MGRPRTANRDRRSYYSPPLDDMGEFEWLMSPPASASASAAESPTLMAALPPFDGPLWDSLAFPSPPMSETFSGPLLSPGFSFEGALPTENISPVSLAAEPDPKSGPAGGAKPATEAVGASCLCGASTIIDVLRSTLRSAVGPEEGLRSAARATDACARSRSCAACAADPSMPIAAFSVLSLAAQVLSAAVDRVLAPPGEACGADAESSATCAHAESAPSAGGGETSTGMSQSQPADDSSAGALSPPETASTASTASVAPAAPSASHAPSLDPIVAVQIGSVALSPGSARRVLLFALQDALRSLCSAGGGMRLGDMAAGLERQVGELVGRLSASLTAEP